MHDPCIAVLNGSTDPPSFLTSFLPSFLPYFGVKNPLFPDACVSSTNKVLFSRSMIDIWVYYTAVCRSHVPHPVPTANICLHTKKENPKIKYKTLSSSVLPVRPLPHSLLGVPAKVCVYFVIFSLIYCHIHISCILLHCYCTGPGYSGGGRSRNELGFGAGERRGG